MAHPQFTISVAVRHLPEETDREAGQFAFAYTVTIRNSGDVTGQLIGRHWIVSDGNGHVEEVRGLAVVGHQPVLKPGETFEYTSWTRLAMPIGASNGSASSVMQKKVPRMVPFGVARRVQLVYSKVSSGLSIGWWPTTARPRTSSTCPFPSLTIQ